MMAGSTGGSTRAGGCAVDRLSPFLQLWLLGGLRGWRRRTLRHRARWRIWTAGWMPRWQLRARLRAGRRGHALRRLVKGYSDTHARGLSKFDRVMEGARWSAAGRTPPTGCAACARRR
jgi:hypothetical protein